MPAESALHFEALEAQAQRIVGVFAAAGYEAVAPAILQPADLFLDVIGEDLRARSYVFADADGAELCLRPDLTVPTCRLHLARGAAADREARYCYNGPAFRFQPGGDTAERPREFRQAGCEYFGATDRVAADVEALHLAVSALATAGLASPDIRIGDLGLFHALLGALSLPERWRQRLRRHFWRPDAFREEVRRLTEIPDAILRGLPADLIATLDPADPAGAEAAVAAHLEMHGIAVTGPRTAADIASGLLAASADARTPPMPAASAELIEAYLEIAGPAPDAHAAITALARRHGIAMAPALDAFARRLELLETVGIAPAKLAFSAEFGRTLEYYTGFVFELRHPARPDARPIAGGGRYDSLLRAVGAPRDVPAVGFAIYTERLLAAGGMA